MIKRFGTNIFFFLIIFYSVGISQNRAISYEDLFKIQNVNEVVISPEKNFIAYTLIVPRPLSDKPGSNYSNLFVYDLSKNSSKQTFKENLNISSIQWSKNSRDIYFIAKLEDEKFSQLYTVPRDGGKLKKVFSENANILSYQISPDGNQIAFVRLDDMNVKKSDLLAKGFDAEIYEEEYQNRNLYIFDVKTNIIKQITSAVSVFEFDWSPDSKSIAAAIADKNLVDDSYMFKRIYIVDTETGLKYKLVENPGKLSQLSFSPDGKHLAFVSAANINDAVSGSLFICEVPNQKKFEELRNYSKGFEGSVISVKWKDNETVLFSSEEGVDITLSEQYIGSQNNKLIIEGGKVVFNQFDYQNGTFAFSGNTSEHPSELFLFNSSDGIKKLTEHNSWLKEIKLARQEKIEYSARDGLRIEGVLIYPLNFESGKRFPLINYIHGGPEAAIQNGWNTGYGSWGQFAAAKDYFVFMPNYRASSGRGVEFTMMGFGDLAGKEFDDVIDGIDYLIRKGYVDSLRVGIGGGSYGGYFSAWAATKHTNRFAASVVFVGIGNQVSKRNTTDIPYEDYYVHWGIWTHENEQLVWDRSPVKYAHLSKTPTLVLHGKEDPRVHPSQGLELYRALKLHSKAPVRMVFYPGQGHGNSKNTARYDYLVRTMEWFDYYLKGNNPKDRMPEKYIEF
jgi:dipeptidyl aminopeptidase/acylaminoacyl peptidase